jgi:hypothetical protein
VPERRMRWPRSLKWKLSSRKRIAPHERASPVDLRKSLEIANHRHTSGFALCRSRWRPKKNSRRWPPSYRDGLADGGRSREE